MATQQSDSRTALLHPFTTDESHDADEDRTVPVFHWPLE
jgi:hypothetical protein